MNAPGTSGRIVKRKNTLAATPIGTPLASRCAPGFTVWERRPAPCKQMGGPDLVLNRRSRSGPLLAPREGQEHGVTSKNRASRNALPYSRPLVSRRAPWPGMDETRPITARARNCVGSRSPWAASLRMRSAKTDLLVPARCSGERVSHASSRTDRRTVTVSESNEPLSLTDMTALPADCLWFLAQKILFLLPRKNLHFEPIGIKPVRTVALEFMFSLCSRAAMGVSAKGSLT
jgi:hypothetical protein